MCVERLDPETELGILALDHYARYCFALDHVLGKHVLDVACGVGYGSWLIAQAGAQYVLGVDKSEDAISVASQRYFHDHVTYKQLDLYSLDPETHGIFDIIVSFETLEHVFDPDAALGILFNLLSPDGLFIVSVPNDIGLKSQNIFHVSKFTEQDFLGVLRKYFRSVKLYYQNFAISSVIWPSDMPYVFKEGSRRPQKLLQQTFEYSNRNEDSRNPDCFIAICSKVSLPTAYAVSVQGMSAWRYYRETVVDRLWDEVRQWYAEAQRLASEFQEVRQQLEVATADRDRLWDEVRQWYAEAQRLASGFQEVRQQ